MKGDVYTQRLKSIFPIITWFGILPLGKSLFQSHQ